MVTNRLAGFFTFKLANSVTSSPANTSKHALPPCLCLLRYLFPTTLTRFFLLNSSGPKFPIFLFTIRDSKQIVPFIVTPGRLVSLVAVSPSDLLGGEPAPGPSPAGIAAELLRQRPGWVGDTQQQELVGPPAGRPSPPRGQLREDNAWWQCRWGRAHGKW